ncbi:hypothetical protein Hs30E_19330 [Lactococcus hodotermopsidis]|uniref:DUF1211 domain-containing membrane protein n=1 Tax=Pseudolactococcus hodotermopsidis TaxID=2709157 RepID=A0A6A0BD96_9LACT|nr:TMEM175 family protein [Lactococcus hodotermopsidis]GFH43382.1 hypothetical protein Hs30E_19330 [Lactococcus hodotermopsidis]
MRKNHEKSRAKMFDDLRADIKTEFVDNNPEFAGKSEEEIHKLMTQHGEEQEIARRRRLKEHWEMFTDAVVAIIITIMLLEIPVPNLAEGHSYHDFVSAVVVFLISFFIVADLWFDHHRLFDGVREVSDKIIVIDFVQLGALAMIPLLTKWIMVDITSFAMLNFGLTVLIVRILQVEVGYEVGKIQYQKTPAIWRLQREMARVRLSSTLFANAFLTIFAWFQPQIGHWLFIVIPLMSFTFGVLEKPKRSLDNGMGK